MIPKQYSFSLVIVLFAITSCKNGTNIKPQDTSTPADVYVAGGITAANGKSAAVYWKNGAMIKVGDSTMNSYGSTIQVVGSDIYLAGYSSAADNTPIATYWKNGVATLLSDGTSECVVSDINVVGSNVYLSGNYRFPVGGINIACHWTNTAASKVIDSAALTYESVIEMVGSDLYLGGNRYKQDANNLRGILVKDGQETDLQHNSMVFGKTTSGSDIYFCGTVYSNTLAADSYAAYWKNGGAVPLGDTTNHAGAYDIAVNGKDVYLAGYNDVTGNNAIPKAVYWKNGKMTTLQGSTSQTGASGIAVIGSDVYVAGEINGGPGYWKNGVPVKLAQTGSVYRIVVVPRMP